jgi:uncharacterized protein (TIGR00251 family)
MGIIDKRIRLRVTAAPIDGKANHQAIKMLAKEFGVARGAITIVRGATSRNKLIRIEQPVKLPPILLANQSTAAGVDGVGITDSGGAK